MGGGFRIDKKWTKKELQIMNEICNPLFFLVRLEGFEPTTYGLEVRCSIQLSYWRITKIIKNHIT